MFVNTRHNKTQTVHNKPLNKAGTMQQLIVTASLQVLVVTEPNCCISDVAKHVSSMMYDIMWCTSTGCPVQMKRVQRMKPTGNPETVATALSWRAVTGVRRGNVTA